MCGLNCTVLKTFYTMRLKLFFSALAVAAIALTGCNKQTELEINYGKTATVKGKVLLSKDSENTPAKDIKVYAVIPYSMLVSNGSGLDGEKIFETTTDAQGYYTFELPEIHPVSSTPATNATIYTASKEDGNGFYKSGSITITSLPYRPNTINLMAEITMNYESLEEEE